MTKFNLTVNQEVLIEADLAKFTPEFCEMFNDTFYPIDGPGGHVKNIAEQFVSRHVAHVNDFLEGYGVLSEMGVTKLRLLGSADTKINEVSPM